MKSKVSCIFCLYNYLRVCIFQVCTKGLVEDAWGLPYKQVAVIVHTHVCQVLCFQLSMPSSGFSCGSPLSNTLSYASCHSVYTKRARIILAAIIVVSCVWNFVKVYSEQSHQSRRVILNSNESLLKPQEPFPKEEVGLQIWFMVIDLLGFNILPLMVLIVSNMLALCKNCEPSRFKQSVARCRGRRNVTQIILITSAAFLISDLVDILPKILANMVSSNVLNWFQTVANMVLISNTIFNVVF